MNYKQPSSIFYNREQQSIKTINSLKSQCIPKMVI